MERPDHVLFVHLREGPYLTSKRDLEAFRAWELAILQPYDSDPRPNMAVYYPKNRTAVTGKIDGRPVTYIPCR